MSDQRVTNSAIALVELGLVAVVDEDAASVIVVLTPLHPDAANEQVVGEWSMN